LSSRVNEYHTRTYSQRALQFGTLKKERKENGKKNNIELNNKKEKGN
jgi:hypothetical protein